MTTLSRAFDPAAAYLTLRRAGFDRRSSAGILARTSAAAQAAGLDLAGLEAGEDLEDGGDMLALEDEAEALGIDAGAARSAWTELEGELAASLEGRGSLGRTGEAREAWKAEQQRLLLLIEEAELRRLEPLPLTLGARAAAASA